MPYADPARKKAHNKAYGAAHSEARTERVRLWNAAHPERARAHQRRYYLRKKYGVTLKEYDRLFELQLGLCAICGSASPGIWQDFVVDHDHKTGEVRGLLCTFCNTGLGQFRDSPVLLKMAVFYLEHS